MAAGDVFTNPLYYTSRSRSKLYRDENHNNGISNVLRERRKDPFFHDVNLLADNIEIPVNKMLLAASSPYFLKMFTSLFGESREKNVQINGIAAEILILIIDYVYTSEILITEENVEDLLAASKLLRFDSISNGCIQFLKDQLQPTNCLRRQAIADLYNFPDIVNYIKIFIDKNFEAVIKSEEFLLLPINEVCSIISRDELRVPTEKVVFRAIVAWIDHDIASRKQHFLLLLKNIRFCYFSEKYAQEIFLNHRLFRDNPESYAYAKAAVDRFFPIVERPVGLTVKPRRYVDLSKVLLVAGGYSERGYPEKIIEYYNFKENSWSKLTDIPLITKCTFIMSVLNGKIYIVDNNMNSVVTYDINNDEWTSPIGIGMQYRAGPGLATLKNCIYAVGGYSSSADDDLNSVEKFDPETEQWTAVAPMLTRRSSHGVGVIDDILYAVGGYDTADYPSSSVECYNPLTNTWAYVNSMHTKRVSCAVGVLNGLLYAVGGTDDKSLAWKSAEVFDPKTGNWTMISDMNTPRSGAAIASSNNLLYVIGGADGSILASVEVYDPETNEWTMERASLFSGRSDHYAAVADKLF